MKLTISGYSTALFSTWYFMEELGLLFDCGDGMASSLLQKSRKIEHVFITHADRDHLTGLLQLNQLNAREGFPVIHYPRDCGSFKAFSDFSMKFDKHVQQTVWKPLCDKEKVWIKKDVYVEAMRNNHVACDEHTYKSFGYRVIQVKSKLKPEYIHLSSEEIKQTIATIGKDAAYVSVETILLSYSGDTPCENFDFWNKSTVLIHEATFLGGMRDVSIQKHGNRHSSLVDVLKAVSTIDIECLVLGHFSSRYSDEEIDTSIQLYAKEFNLKIPVYRILPGRTVKDILSGEAIYSP